MAGPRGSSPGAYHRGRLGHFGDALVMGPSTTEVTILKRSSLPDPGASVSKMTTEARHPYTENVWILGDGGLKANGVPNDPQR